MLLNSVVSLQFTVLNQSEDIVDLFVFLNTLLQTTHPLDFPPLVALQSPFFSPFLLNPWVWVPLSSVGSCLLFVLTLL